MNRTNVKAKPKKDFNACHDFFVLVTQCHIVAAALTFLNMVSLEDEPSTEIIPDPVTAWMLPDDERKKQLQSVCEAIVTKFVDFRYHEKPSPKSMKSISGSKHAGSGSDMTVGSKCTGSGDDKVHQYASQILSLGCFYLEFCDGINEGAGKRNLRCWRYLLPIFRGSGRKNYSIEALVLLCQHRYFLSPRLSSQLLWSRSVNVHGRAGKNIPGDLYMEHLNRVAKECISHLGAGKTPKAICRVGKAIGTIAPVLDQFDVANSIKKVSGAHKPPSNNKDMNTILNFLLQQKVFTVIPKRAHHSFPKPRNALHQESNSKLLSWMTDRLL